MSIDFATIKSWEIPEGKVAKIVDALGNVLWSAVKLANLTITSFWDGMDGDSARITITSPSPFAPNPNEPNNKVTSWTAYVYDLFDQQNRTIKIPVGSTIECYITRDKGNADSYIKLNGVSVATGEGTYVYTVTGDVTIDVSEEYVQGDYGVISIVGAVTYISFTMNGDTYQAIEGMSWSAWFASSYNTTGETKGTITDANGNEVSMDAVIVSGATYEVGFVTDPVITIIFDPDTYESFGETQYRCGNLKIGDTTYAPAFFLDNAIDQYTLTLPVGTVIGCIIRASGTGYAGEVRINGKTVLSGGYQTYEYTVTTNATIVLTATVKNISNFADSVYITEL